MEILDLLMEENDADAVTVRDYLKALLTELWIEEEGFSGKRPFGNSGWQYDVYTALIKSDMVEGTLDEDGYIEDCDSEEADKLILEAIRMLQ